MRKISALIAAAAIGAVTVAAPGSAEARFGAAAIADAVAETSMVQLAQQRSQRAPRRTAPPRTATQPPQTTPSPYVFPGSRGALLNCSFC